MQSELRSKKETQKIHLSTDRVEMLESYIYEEINICVVPMGGDLDK